MAFDDGYHIRRSIRLNGYDYSSSGAYFVTICTWDRRPLFGAVVTGEMRLNCLGEMVREEWLQTEIVRPYVKVDCFIVMPDHTHAIVMLENPISGAGGCVASAPHAGGHLLAEEKSLHPSVEPGSLGAIVGQFKSVVAKRINRYRNTPGVTVWQRNYYERIIRDEREMIYTRRYIAENPARWCKP